MGYFNQVHIYLQTKKLDRGCGIISLEHLPGRERVLAGGGVEGVVPELRPKVQQRHNIVDNILHRDG